MPMPSMGGGGLSLQDQINKKLMERNKAGNKPASSESSSYIL